jgi:hypothetical protein
LGESRILLGSSAATAPTADDLVDETSTDLTKEELASKGYGTAGAQKLASAGACIDRCQVKL